MTDEMSTYQLDVELTREDVVEWLGEVPEEMLAETVENHLAAGLMVLNLVQASTGEDAMKRFFRPVLHEMDKLEGTIGGLLKAASKSQRLGEIGENIVASLLQQAFPGDTFEVTAKEGHVADIRAQFDVGGGQMRAGIIEVKLYSHDVPSKELDKFRRDMAETKVRYGLMVSLTSRLTGIKGPLMVEQTEDSVAIFVPNAGLEENFKLLLAAMFLKAIAAYEARADQAALVPAGAVEAAWQRLNDEMAELQSVCRDVQDFRKAVRTAQQNLTDALDTVHASALSAELRLQHAVERLTQRVLEEFQTLPTTAPAKLPRPSTPDVVLAALNSLREAKDKRTPVFERLYDLSKSISLEVGVVERGQWTFLRDGKPVANTSGTKTRLDLIFPILDASKPVQLLPSCEKIAKGALTVQGNDPDQLLERAKVHFVG
jgi:hypothetical protein